MKVPELTAASVMRPDHPFHPHFNAYLERRAAAHGEEAGKPSKRKARAFLRSHPTLHLSLRDHSRKAA